MARLDTDGMFQYYPSPPDLVRKDRFERLTAMLARQNCKALAVAGRGLYGQRGNLRFVSNYSPVTQNSLALFTPGAPPRLLVPYPIHVYWAGSTSWFEDIQLTSDYAADAASYLQSVGCEGATIGIASAPFISWTLVDDLKRHLPKASFKSVDEPLMQVRVAKSSLDLQFIQFCADLIDVALDRLKTIMKPGVTENDLMAEVEYVLRKAGAEGSLELITSTARHTTPLPSHRKLQPGDVVVISIEPVGPGGFIVQVQRTFSIGKPTAEVRQAFDACREIEERTRDQLVPGNKAKAAAAAGLEVFKRVGGSKQSMILGHGIGIDLGEAPRISAQDETTLEADMVIALHPNLYRERFGVHLGNSYRLTPEGPKSLIRTPSDLIVL